MSTVRQAAQALLVAVDQIRATHWMHWHPAENETLALAASELAAALAAAEQTADQEGGR